MRSWAGNCYRQGVLLHQRAYGAPGGPTCLRSSIPNTALHSQAYLPSGCSQQRCSSRWAPLCVPEQYGVRLRIIIVGLVESDDTCQAY